LSRDQRATVKCLLAPPSTTLRTEAAASKKGTLTFNTAALTPGIYLLRVVGVEGGASRHFTVAR
ncbi:MAG: hypothetical protein AAFN13_10230, partial [Bacteroidota bacterium]